MANTVSNTISDDTLNRIIQIESNGVPSAKAATSTATGLGQHLNATWLNLVNKYHKEWWNGRTKDQVLNLRKNPSLSIELLTRLTEENARMVGSTSGGDLYLAHFLGPADAKDLFRAAPNTPVTSLVSDAVVRANRSIMLNKDGTSKTAADVRAWAKRKMSNPAEEDWVRKFYTGKGPDPKRVVPRDEPSPVDEDTKGTAIEKPEPPEPRRDPDDEQQDIEQDAEEDRRDPVPEVKPAPKVTEEQITPKPREGFFDWINRKRKTVAGWFGGILSGGSFLTYISDWKIALVGVFGLLAAVVLIYLFWLLSQRKKPKPVEPS